MAFIHHGTRQVWLSEPTFNPHEDWVIRQTKGAFWWFEDKKLKLRYLIRDRDSIYSKKFDEVIKELTGNKRGVVRTSIRAPDMNSFIESYIGHAKNECHDHYYIFRSLGQYGHANAEYMKFYNTCRPHQSLDNCVPDPTTDPPVLHGHGQVHCRKFCGGLLRHYYRVAA
jgi:putative transposase